MGEWSRRFSRLFACVRSGFGAVENLGDLDARGIRSFTAGDVLSHEGEQVVAQGAVFAGCGGFRLVHQLHREPYADKSTCHRRGVGASPRA